MFRSSSDTLDDSGVQMHCLHVLRYAIELSDKADSNVQNDMFLYGFFRPFCSFDFYF